MPAKLIVAYSDSIFREIISTIFQQIDSLELVAKAATAEELLQATATHQPDIIVAHKILEPAKHCNRPDAPMQGNT